MWAGPWRLSFVAYSMIRLEGRTGIEQNVRPTSDKRRVTSGESRSRSRVEALSHLHLVSAISFAA